jgi:hypothetical protein
MCTLIYSAALSGIVVIIIAVFVSSVILLIGIICIKWLIFLLYFLRNEPISWK